MEKKLAMRKICLLGLCLLITGACKKPQYDHKGKTPLVELDGKPFQKFASMRDTWARETDYVYPGPIQYFGPTEVCDQPTKTLQLEQCK